MTASMKRVCLVVVSAGGQRSRVRTLVRQTFRHVVHIQRRACCNAREFQRLDGRERVLKLTRCPTDCLLGRLPEPAYCYPCPADAKEHCERWRPSVRSAESNPSPEGAKDAGIFPWPGAGRRGPDGEMTAVIHFRPLCGAMNEDPFMYLLTIDECKILLDCGWNDSFDVKLLEPLKAYVSTLSLSETSLKR